MTADDGQERNLVKKPTSCLTNAEYLIIRLELQCTGDHHHVHLITGRATHARIYPDDLCKQIGIGIKEQMAADGKLTDKKIPTIFDEQHCFE